MSRQRNWKAAKFCPWCGTKTLERDYYKDDHKNRSNYPQFTCSLCCRGFMLRPSVRTANAEMLMAAERKAR